MDGGCTCYPQIKTNTSLLVRIEDEGTWLQWVSSRQYMWYDILNGKIASREIDHEGVVVCSEYGPQYVWYDGAQLYCEQCGWHSNYRTKKL
jgi:hypothetical protein